MSEGRSRYWRATLGEAEIEAEGLDTILDAIFDKWGGPRRNSQSVRQALTVGEGQACIATEAGLVMLLRDNELGKTRAVAEVQDKQPDGRVRTFYGVFTLIAVDKDGGSVVLEENHSGEGLMRLVERCVGRVHAVAGEIPSCMTRTACTDRERGWRVQISRGKGKTIINFPSLTDESAHRVHDQLVFVAGQKPYTAMLRILAEPPHEKQQQKIERAAFARKA